MNFSTSNICVMMFCILQKLFRIMEKQFIMVEVLFKQFFLVSFSFS